MTMYIPKYKPDEREETYLNETRDTITLNALMLLGTINKSLEHFNVTSARLGDMTITLEGKSVYINIDEKLLVYPLPELTQE